MKRKQQNYEQNRELVFSITAKDCEMQTFSSGGPGGQNQNRRSTGVRFIHHPSGARGEARDARSQDQNKKAAWKRMTETPAFKLWIKKQLGQEVLIEAEVERAMWPVNIKTEVRENGRWTPESSTPSGSAE